MMNSTLRCHRRLTHLRTSTYINQSLKNLSCLATNNQTLLKLCCLATDNQTLTQHSCLATNNHSSTNNRCLATHNYNILCHPMYQARVHSTQSDQRRQKVALPTAPKIVIEKIEGEGRSSLNAVWSRNIEPYVKLARWDRPIGVYLLYWPCSWSIALASIQGTVPLSTTLETAGLFLLGAGLMRGAGCTINDMWDKDIDAQVERTKCRPLVAGTITNTQAWGFLAAQLSLALGVLMQLNCYSVVLGASSMVLVITYPLAKRFTNYPQIFLGATFNWGALLGYSAIMGNIDPFVCVPLYTGALAWTVVYDTIYAHQDKLDDARIGMKSTALTFGSRTKPLLYLALSSTVLCTEYVGLVAGLDWPYHVAIGLVAARISRQIYKLDVDNPDQCNETFKSNSFIGLLILLGILGGGYRQYINNRQKNHTIDNIDITKSCFFS